MKQLQGKDLKFGDLVLIDDRRRFNFMAYLIRFVEYGGEHPIDRFMAHHLGFVAEENENLEEVVVWEASMLGVRKTPLKRWMRNARTNLEVRRYTRRIHKSQIEQFNKWFEERKGLGYDFGALFGYLARWCAMELAGNKLLKILVKFFFGKNYLQSKIRFHCSELYYLAFKEVLGVSLWREICASFVTPYDLQKSKKLRLIGKWYQFEYEKL